jgi:tRNA A37 N6-isopentenylltransferase MiaA
MSDEEKKVEEELTKKEKQHDAMRAKMEAEINSRRLQRAKELMDKLSKTDSLINELVHHTVKVSQMPSHMPQTTD